MIMKLKRLQVLRLFNTFDYDINFDSEERILLLTGPNGYGKTTILTIIDNVINGHFIDFYYLPFSHIELQMEDDTIIQVSSDKDVEKGLFLDDREIAPDRIVSFKLLSKDNLMAGFDITAKSIKEMKQRLRGLRDYSTERGLLTDAALVEYLRSHSWQYFVAFDANPGFSQFEMMLHTMDVFFEPANRILLQEEGNTKVSIEKISSSLRAELERTRIEYLKKVSEYRGNLIDKLLTGEIKYRRKEYESIVDSLRDKIELLHSWGLIPFNSFKAYDAEKPSVMSVYLEEIVETTEVYSSIYKKVSGFVQIINKKAFVNKTISYSSESGLLVQLPDGSSLDCKKLSSGEQNEIIMAYHLIFGLHPEMLVLVDEPENSLHVEWQTQYIDELEEICEVNDLQAIVATHSPQIIGERWNICYDLYEATEE